MEDKSELNPQELNSKNYENFLGKCRQDAIRLIATEAPKDSINLISEAWDNFESELPETDSNIDKVMKLLKKRLSDLGVETIPDNTRDLNDVSLTSLANDYRFCFLAIKERPEQIQKLIVQKNDLEERTSNLDLGQFSHAHPFFQEISRIETELIDFIDIMNRRSSEINLPNGALDEANKTKEIATKINQYLVAVFDSVRLENDSRNNPNYYKDNLAFIQPIMLPIALSITDAAGEEECTVALNNIINGTLNTWLKNEEYFLNIEKAPKKMQGDLHTLMLVTNTDSAKFPTGIIGKPLDDLISDSIDPDQRAYFMYIYSLRALTNNENDQYLEELYKEKYEKKNK